ncbi:MAG: lytic transglycosylase domain-containing protein [Saprospiraceae bacterium]|nr:lytic transglycosylase domain-containing protein [Saprospiraceae bacterium]
MLAKNLIVSLLLCVLTMPLLAFNEEFNEVEVIERLNKMDCDVIKPRYTVIVKGYLKNYLLWNRPKAERIIGRSVLYFPIFEEYIKKYNMPEDLKYLSVVESALDPVAMSRVGALGLWQFMPETGLEVGLKINKYIDERQDPRKSTDAAMRYLRQQYRHFGSWELALAAYNGGSGRVSRAIKRGRSKNFWTIRKYLPTETANYVPAFIAACYVGHHFEEHGIKPTLPELDYQITETITVYDYLTFYSPF